MARRGNRERIDPEFLRKCEEQIAAWMRGEGDEPFFAPGQPNFLKPPKGSVKSTACQTPDCAGKAYHKTTEYPGTLLRWFHEPNSFYCRSCQVSRGLIVTALTLLVGLFAPLSLPTFGFWTTLWTFSLLGGTIVLLPPWLMKAAK